jgi:pyroglutamyl-peptidase
MPRILITAFEPYERWAKNASWLTLIEFTKTLDTRIPITTRLYPVDFVRVRRRLEIDLAGNFDYAIHLGQAPGTAAIQLEAIGLNVGPSDDDANGFLRPLEEQGPLAYGTSLPLGQWREVLREAGIPATLSYHAGTYLCNATLYLSRHLSQQRGLPTQAMFMHVPLDPSQTANDSEPSASLPADISARALGLIVEQMVKQSQLRDLELA